MKVDRVLEIVLYLFNHENVSARKLAEHFHVSTRTIQRDMISISNIGIPLYSEMGNKGGYSILPDYKLKNTDIKDEEQQIVIKALESLASSYTNDTLNSVIEKYNAIYGKKDGQKIFWDFSITKEDNQVQTKNNIIENAIKHHSFISFEYRNAEGKISQQTIEPLAIHYKWYAWYLFAYNEKSTSYRTFKVARIQNLITEKRISKKDHGDIKKLMDESEQAYYKTCIHIEIQFSKNEIPLIEEYFPDCIIEKTTNTICKTFIDVPEKERLWKALLLSFGNKVKVISPESYKNELLKTAKDFISKQN